MTIWFAPRHTPHGACRAKLSAWPERLAYFAFDLLHLDGHDLRPCAIEDRKALLRDVTGTAGGERIVFVDHIVRNGAALFKVVRQVGGEGIVSKRAGSRYRGGPNRDWLKVKVSDTSAFVITGYIEREAVAVAELKDGVLVPVGLVKFGPAGKGLWPQLERRRAGPASRAGIIPVRPELGRRWCAISGAFAVGRSATACWLSVG